MKISVFGLGHVGLVYAAGFASVGFHVKGFDIDAEKARMLNQGKLPMIEPNLMELIDSGRKNGMLVFTEDCNDAVLSSDACFVAVNTPLDKEGRLDLGQVLSCTRMIGKSLRNEDGYHLVVIKSTVPPGTTSGLVKETLEKESGRKAFLDFGLAVNPEFMREANAVHDFFEANRIVIGVNDERSRKIITEVYAPFKCPKIITNFNNAEMIKYSSNSFLAMKISFINMIANICQKIPGADVEVVGQGMGLDERISPHLLRPSLGWGGSCYLKDNTVLLNLAKELGVEAPLIEATLEANEEQPQQAVKIAEEVLGSLKGKRVAVLGLSFKENTDDVRGTVSKKVINLLKERGAKVVAYDPCAMDNYRMLGKSDNAGIELAKSERDCLNGAECAIIVTGWKHFEKLTAEDYLKTMMFPLLIDGVRIYDPKKYEKITYRAIGRGPNTDTWNGLVK